MSKNSPTEGHDTLRDRHHMRWMLLRTSNSRLRSVLLALPLTLLLIGMFTIFFFGNDRGVLYRNNWKTFHHMQWVSSQHLTIADNLSPSHYFLQFMSQGFDEAGNIYYDVYNRFPPGGYMLIKLVTLPLKICLIRSMLLRCSC